VTFPARPRRLLPDAVALPARATLGSQRADDEYGRIEYGGLPVNQSRCTADDFLNVVGNSTLEDRVGGIADMG
jgi:hypothetical protein